MRIWTGGNCSICGCRMYSGHHHVSEKGKASIAQSRRRRGSPELKGKPQYSEFIKRRIGSIKHRERMGAPGRIIDRDSPEYLAKAIHLRQLGEKQRGKPGHKHTEEYKKKMSEMARLWWQDPEFLAKVMQRVIPTKPEKALGMLLNKLYPGQYKYTGDGSFSIKGLIPDFVNVNGQKKVIEMFGDYWHSPKITAKDWRATEEGRMKIMGEYGYACLVVWEKELKFPETLIEKIQNFHMGRIIYHPNPCRSM